MNKINNVYIFDLQMTLKRRLFAEDLDDSFRPFISGGFGPVFGMNFPEDESLKDQYEWSFPTPLSPVTNTEISVGATWMAFSMARFN